MRKEIPSVEVLIVRAADNVEAKKREPRWIADNLPRDTYLNLMSQYRPMHEAFDYPLIARRLTRKEYEEVVDYAKGVGLTNLDIQGWRG